MCFSATASFLVSAGTAVAGIGSLRHAKKNSRFLAAVPFLFAIQQFFEGLLWLTAGPGIARHIFGHAFLFFAYSLWPLGVPLAAHQLERNTERKKILKGFVLAGAAVSVHLGIAMLTQPLGIVILPQGIDYNIRVPYLLFMKAAYVVVVVGPLIISTHAFLRRLGFILAGSAMFTIFFFRETFISVWCFFAAAMSMMVYLFHAKRRG